MQASNKPEGITVKEEQPPKQPAKSCTEAQSSNKPVGIDNREEQLPKQLENDVTDTNPSNKLDGIDSMFEQSEKDYYVLEPNRNIYIEKASVKDDELYCSI